MTNKTIGDLLQRIKNTIDIEDDLEYKRVTVRSKNQGVFLRDTQVGAKIGTKKQFKIKEGLFLLSKIDARNGAFGIVPKELDGAIITGNFWAYEINHDILNIEWFNLFVSTQEFITICDKASSGTTNRKYLNEELFLKFTIDLPTLIEQERMLEKYKKFKAKYDLALSEIMNQQSILKKLYQTVLYEAIQGKLVKQNSSEESADISLKKIQEEKVKRVKEKTLKKITPLSEINEKDKPYHLPDGWVWGRLSDLGELARGKSKHRPRNDARLFTQGNYPFIQTGDVNPEQFYINSFSKQYNEFGLSQSRLFPKDTLCITIAANIANSSLLSIEACFPDSIVGFIPISPADKTTSMYLNYFIKTIRNELETFAPATAQKNINLGILNEVLVPIPPLEEQKRIVEKVEVLMKKSEILQNKINESKLEVENIMEAILKETLN